MSISELKEIINQKFDEYVKILGLEFEDELTDKDKFQKITDLLPEKFEDFFEDDTYKSDIDEEGINWLLWHIPGGKALVSEE